MSRIPPDDGRGVLLAYVREHPGEWAWLAVARGRGDLSRRQAGRLVRLLLRENPAALRSDRMPTQDALQARLWLAGDDRQHGEADTAGAAGAG